MHDRGFVGEGRGIREGLRLSPVSPRLPVYQQPQQQQVGQSYGGYKEPAAPVSVPRCAPGGGGVSSSGQRESSWSWEVGWGPGSLRRPEVDGQVDIAQRFSLETPPRRPGFP